MEDNDDKWNCGTAVSIIEGEATISEAMGLAEKALSNGDIADAHFHWSAVRRSPNAPIEAWLNAAANSKHANADPIALLNEAITRFPKNGAPLHDLARMAERRCAWGDAEKYWRAFIRIDATKWWAFVALAICQRNQNRRDEALSILLDAARQFPDELDILSELANTEQIVDLKGALMRWDAIIARAPSRWVGYRGKIAALQAAGCREEADHMHSEYVDRFLHDTDAIHDGARFAERHGDWPKAIEYWNRLMALERRMPWAYQSLAAALCKNNQIVVADAVLTEAAAKFPTEATVATQCAKCSELLNDWKAAEKRWQSVCKLVPTDPVGWIGIANALRHLGRNDEADAVIRRQMDQFEGDSELHESHCLNAIAKGDWGVALHRVRDAIQRFPNHRAFSDLANDIRLRCVDSGVAVSTETQAELDNSFEGQERSLVLEFESLGGGGHGCEFGIFQRQMGAEPLGLLRWADLDQDHLAEALENNFAGVGEDAYTRVFIPPNSQRPEYWTRDVRYHMAMRCFAYVDEVPMEIMVSRVRKRLTYLRNKLLDDLRAASKILVYKNMKRNLTPEELHRLYMACRRLGACTLFYIQYADSQNTNGIVREIAPGLIVGYIDHFSHTPDTDEYISLPVASLIRLCRRAYAIRFLDLKYSIREDAAVLYDHAEYLLKKQMPNESKEFYRKIREKFHS